MCDGRISYIHAHHSGNEKLCSFGQYIVSIFQTQMHEFKYFELIVTYSRQYQRINYMGYHQTYKAPKKYALGSSGSNISVPHKVCQEGCYTVISSKLVYHIFQPKGRIWATTMVILLCLEPFSKVHLCFELFIRRVSQISLKERLVWNFLGFIFIRIHQFLETTVQTTWPIHIATQIFMAEWNLGSHKGPYSLSTSQEIEPWGNSILLHFPQI